jgi:YD repeat-containing protein
MVQKISRLFLIIGAVIFSLSLHAQKNPYSEVSIASPTAASLGKYADIPVNYHTGVPAIDIPIYSVKEGALSLPISLSYHASGIKVEEPAGWVGLGWALNAGGVITRTVQGAPDERATSNIYNQTDGHFSDSGYNNYLWINQDPWMMDWQHIAEGSKDGEPDLFFFNFGNYSGKFYFNDDRSAVLVPQQDIRITPTYTGSGSIQSFVITTPDGIKYYFGITTSGTDVDPIERTNPFTAQSGMGTGTVISSWYLNKVESADGLFSINLTYTTENYSYYSLSTFPVKSDTSLNEYEPVKNFVDGVRLSSINFSNGTVTFTPSSIARTDLGDQSYGLSDNVNTQAKALASIDISDNNGYCKSFVFSTSYFTDNTALTGYLFTYYNLTTDSKRLKLLSVQEKSCDGLIILPAHVFNYFTETTPRRLSFGQDYWGFYNGVTNNTKLIPTYTEDNFAQVAGANRKPAWPAMRGGTLKRITYPTGGYTDLDYEAHTTWVSSIVYADINRFSMYLGFGNDSSSKSELHSLTANPYKINLNNIGGTHSGNVTIRSGTSAVFTFSLMPGQSKDTITQLAAGSYWIDLTKQYDGASTGLQTTFYERIPSLYQRNDTVGGLRIKTITTNDGVTNKTIVQNYSYIDSTGKSTGILFSRPVFVQKVRNDILKEIGYQDLPMCSPAGCITCPGSADYYKSPAPIRPMETTQGNHIGYRDVKVSESGNGYTIYHYTIPTQFDTDHSAIAVLNIMKTVCDNTIPNFPAAPLPFDYTRGELNKVQSFSKTGQLIKETEYQNMYSINSITTPGLIVHFSPYAGEEGNFVANLATFYSLSTAKKISTTTIDRVFDANGNKVETKNITYYESAFHTQVTRTKGYASNGDSVEAKTKYINDFRLSSCDAISNCYPEYTSATSSCGITYGQTISSCVTHTCLWDAWQTYQHCLSDSRISYIYCRSTNVPFINTCHTNAKNSAGVELRPILELQDENQMAPVELSNWRNTQLTSASFYRYDSSTALTKVYFNKVQAINLPSPSSAFTNAAVNGSGLTKDSRYTEEGSYKFLSGNPAEAKNRNAYSKSYVWDYNNNLPVAVVSNATGDQIAATSFEADGKGNFTFSGSTVIDATAPTGTKCYNLNGGDISKSGLTIGNKYVISFWSKSGMYTITGATTTNTTGKIINGWTFYERLATATATTITISGNNKLDELRLYPSDAQMVTYTYDPLIGVTTECDGNNRISYYEYDALGRLTVVRDQDKNVLKKICYNFSGQATNCDLVTPITIAVTNYSGSTGVVATYTNLATGTITNFNVPASGSTNFSLSSGNYDLVVNRSAGNANYIFTTCNLQTNCGTTIHNINVSATSCNTLIVDSLF